MIRTSENENRIAVGITHGDINSISYEVIIKACLDQRITELFVPIVYGTSKAASYHRKMLNIPDFSFNIIRSADQASPKKANLVNLSDKEVKIEMGESTVAAGEMALLSINAAVEDLKKGLIDVMVTAPVNKHNVQESMQQAFTGHTGWSSFDQKLFIRESLSGGDHCKSMRKDAKRGGLETGVCSASTRNI